MVIIVDYKFEIYARAGRSRASPRPHDDVEVMSPLNIPEEATDSALLSI